MITRKQKKFLDALKEMVRIQGYFPSVREIAKQTDLSSPATVHAYLNRLHERGYLVKHDHYWELVPDYSAVPLVGIVPAGNPLEVFAPMGEEVELPEWMVENSGETVAFRVQGESMKDAYIQEGDIVIVKRVYDAAAGEMVVALLEDSSLTLKRLKRKGKKVWLKPENPDYEAIEAPFQVVGKVVGVLRRYR
jgi:repressor LexA